jgi:hypothetical protein
MLLLGESSFFPPARVRPGFLPASPFGSFPAPHAEKRKLNLIVNFFLNRTGS